TRPIQRDVEAGNRLHTAEVDDDAAALLSDGQIAEVRIAVVVRRYPGCPGVVVDGQRHLVFLDAGAARRELDGFGDLERLARDLLGTLAVAVRALRRGRRVLLPAVHESLCQLPAAEPQRRDQEGRHGPLEDLAGAALQGRRWGRHGLREADGSGAR